jgi:Fur family peroxide stress response transcriptional regulator
VDPTGRKDRTLERFKAAAQEAGVKMTHQRLEIFRELATTEEHPDAETLYRAVVRRVPTVSRDTVYRTLAMLGGLGLVTPLGPQREGVRFEANQEPHHHYVCVECGLVRDFESEELSRLRVPTAVTRLGTIEDAHVEVRGLCARCQRGREKPRSPSKSRGTSERSTS